MKFIFIASAFILVLMFGTYFTLQKFYSSRWPAARRLPWISVLLNIGTVAGIGIGFSRWQGTMVSKAFIQLAAIWIMLQITFIVLTLIAEGTRYLRQRTMAVPVDPERRKLAKYMLIAPGVAAASSVYGGVAGKDATIVNNIKIPVAGLGKRLQGYKIAQLSDIHLGVFFDLQKLEELMEQVSRTKADVLVIAGDLFDDNRLNYKAAQLIDKYTSAFPQGIYYCRGNHEHIRGIQAIEIALSQTSIRELLNENVLLVDDIRPLYLAGVDYPMDREQFTVLQQLYTKKALDNIPEGAVKVLLAHHPDFLDSAKAYNTELVLSGHTHGGQIGICGISLAPPVFKYMRGMYQQGNTRCYVHCGNGSWFPYRLGCPPEIAVFELQQA